ncbi:hypothetical protein LENED_004727 [Lentinula edodes]|uniref:Uncharacterized protein n=1 Tax=Lentinula edodes TaxID=5353 RepID=A0A1Q3E7L3_LENED|nr:hypothetical protein LENED_004727 [Lentinula edodes]
MRLRGYRVRAPTSSGSTFRSASKSDGRRNTGDRQGGLEGVLAFVVVSGSDESSDSSEPRFPCPSDHPRAIPPFSQ